MSNHNHAEELARSLEYLAQQVRDDQCTLTDVEYSLTWGSNQRCLTFTADWSHDRDAPAWSPSAEVIGARNLQDMVKKAAAEEGRAVHEVMGELESLLGGDQEPVGDSDE